MGTQTEIVKRCGIFEHILFNYTKCVELILYILEFNSCITQNEKHYGAIDI
jgi:hypothetical protein